MFCCGRRLYQTDQQISRSLRYQRSGGTNALTGVLGGWLDSIPMFIVSGQVKRETTTWSTDVPVRQLGDQEYQIDVESVKPMTKYAHMIVEANEIAYHLEKGIILKQSRQRRPCVVRCAVRYQAAIVDTDDLKHFDKSNVPKRFRQR